MSQILKVAIAFAVALGLFAVFMANNSGEHPDTVEVTDAPAPVMELETVTKDVAQAAPQKPAPRPKRPKMSDAAKETRARQENKREMMSLHQPGDPLAKTDSLQIINVSTGQPLDILID